MPGIIALMIVTLNFQSQGQIVLRNPVLEYCTGTWCQYCPCGHAIINNNILPNIPNAIIIAYHGPAGTTSDPWSVFPGNSIIAALGFSSYPTGNVDRISASPLDRSQWYSAMNTRWNIWATVRISLVTKTYDEATRTLEGTVSVTPANQLTGTYKLSLILLESGLNYPQTGNVTAGCIGGNPYNHDHVVKAMINDYLGETLNTTSPWAVGQTITKNLNYTLPTGVIASNSKFVAFVYKVGSTLSTSEIQQAEQWDVPGTVTSADEPLAIPARFAISQNYPNPFNPTTQFDYAVSSRSFVSITVYDLLGREVKSLVSDEKAAGVYKAEWDGTDNAGTVLPSGMYLYRMTAGNFAETKKMILMK